MKRALLLAASVLVLVGCKPGGASSTAHLKGDPAEASAALAAMGLDASRAEQVSFGNTALDGAKAEFTNVRIMTPGEGEGEAAAPVPLNVAKMVFEGLSTDDAGLAQFGRLTLEGIALNVAATPGEPQSFTDPTTGEVIDLGVSAGTPGVDFGVGKIVFDNPSPEVAAWVAALLRGEAEPTAPAFEAWKFDGLDIAGLNMKFEDPEGKIDIDLTSISAKDLGAGMLGRGALNGLSIALDFPVDGQSMVGKVALDELAFDALNINYFAHTLRTLSPEAAVPAEVKLPVSPIDPGMDDATVKGLLVDVGGVTFSLPSASQNVTRDGEGRATRVQSPAASMTLTADPAKGPLGEQLGMFLGGLGYETIEISGQSEASWNATSDATDVKGYRLSLKDGFDFTLQGELFKLGPVMTAIQTLNVSQDPTAMLEAVQQVSIGGLELEIDDNSFLERLFNFIALQSGEEPAAMRSQAANALLFATMAAQGAGIDPALATATVTPISQFVGQGGKLTLKLAPPQPLVLGSLSNPASLTADNLGITVTRTE